MPTTAETMDIETILRVTGVANDQIPQEMELLRHLSPLGARLITSKPQIAAYHEGRESAGGISIPDVALRSLKEFGLIAWVLAIGDTVCPDIIPGIAVLIPEYAGLPIYLHRATPYYILGEGDVMATVTV